jgi:acyl-coenzyme A synthetase/AMP-(fatty) acid ligase
MGASAGGAIRVQRVAQIPKTATGKVQRRKLAEMFTPLRGAGDSRR